MQTGQPPPYPPIRGVLIDLGGVVYVGEVPLPGAIDALHSLHAAGLPIRFITNTTRIPKRVLIERLSAMGIAVEADELLTPAEIARSYLVQHRLSPCLLVHQGLEEDFAGVPAGDREAVVIGDVGAALTYDRLNSAYRKLANGAALVALANNRNFLDDDGLPSLDAGPFVAALEYASRQKAIVLGKPSPAFFAVAVKSLRCSPDAAVMIGDDAEADIGGAMDAGLLGILVRTGKYRAGAEDHLRSPPTYVADDLSGAIEHILQRSQGH